MSRNSRFDDTSPYSTLWTEPLGSVGFNGGFFSAVLTHATHWEGSSGRLDWIDSLARGREVSPRPRPRPHLRTLWTQTEGSDSEGSAHWTVSSGLSGPGVKTVNIKNSRRKIRTKVGTDNELGFPSCSTCSSTPVGGTAASRNVGLPATPRRITSTTFGSPTESTQ